MDRVSEAFKAVNRAYFLPPETVGLADADMALPIGHGQTISQPTTVRMMLEWLDMKEGDHVLDVGSGSGWTTALLSHIVGSKGRVYAVEKVPELVKFGRENAKRAGVKNAEFYQAKDELGLPEHAPYDRILVSASAVRFPAELLDQLKEGGKIVVPVGYDIFEVTKSYENQYDTQTHSGFIFVPLL